MAITHHGAREEDVSKQHSFTLMEHYKITRLTWKHCIFFQKKYVHRTTYFGVLSAQQLLGFRLCLDYFYRFFSKSQGLKIFFTQNPSQINTDFHIITSSRGWDAKKTQKPLSKSISTTALQPVLTSFSVLSCFLKKINILYMCYS